MKKQSFFKNSKQKLYYKDGRTLITITESRCQNLFLYLWERWKGFTDEYNRINEKIPQYKHETIERHLSHEHFYKLKEGLPNVAQSIEIVLSSNSKPIIRINNKDAIAGKYDKPYQ